MGLIVPAEAGATWTTTPWTRPLGSTIWALTWRSAVPCGLFETRAVDGADPAGEGPAHFVGRNDEADRVDGPNLGHGHADELAGLLLDDRAAAVARLERAVDLEQRDLPVIVATQGRDPPAGDRDRGIAFALGDLAEHAAQWETRADVGHAFGRVRFGEHVDRRGRILHTLHNQKRQVRAEIVGRVGGDDLGRKGLLVLRPLAAAEDRPRAPSVLPLGTMLGGHFRQVDHRDVPIGRQDDGVARAPRSQSPYPTPASCPRPCS